MVVRGPITPVTEFIALVNSSLKNRFLSQQIGVMSLFLGRLLIKVSCCPNKLG